MALSKYLKTDLKSKINKNHEASISAKERASQFKNDMYIMDDRMYCRFCASVVNHVRKSTVLEHIGSAAHRSRKEQEKKQAAEAQSQSNKPISTDDGDITDGNNGPTSTAAINKNQAANGHVNVLSCSHRATKCKSKNQSRFDYGSSRGRYTV